MRLLADLEYLKFKKCNLNEGTQVETAEKFYVKQKALSKLLSGCRYFGGKDQKTPRKRKTSAEEEKCPVRKSCKSSTAAKPPDDDDDSKDKEGS